MADNVVNFMDRVMRTPSGREVYFRTMNEEDEKILMKSSADFDADWFIVRLTDHSPLGMSKADKASVLLTIRELSYGSHGTRVRKNEELLAKA